MSIITTGIKFEKKPRNESRLVGVIAATSLLIFVILPVLMLAGLCTLMYIAIQTVRKASTPGIVRR